MFLLRDLVSPRTWLAMTSHLAGLFTGMLVMVVVVTGLSLGFSLVVLALAGLPLLGLTLRFADWFAVAERARIGLMLGARIPVWPAGSRAGYRWYVVPRWRTLTQRATWGEIGYALLRLPVSAVALTLSVSAWSAALVLLTLPLYNKYLPSGGAAFGDTVLKGTPTMTASVAVGLIVLLIAPQVTRGFGLMDAKLSRWLLGPPSDLAARVTELEISRERVVGAAEAERRRIERDLHDGAQQRLVALAMELGRAKAKFSDDPDAARVLVDQAHSQAKEALSELRNLVRGVHPPVLTERGLDAALSGLAALCPIPVDVHVDVPVRPKSAVEAVAYFMVAEALTNVAKHSRASHAKVVVEGHGYPGTLTVMVSDDGIGGRQPGQPRPVRSCRPGIRRGRAAHGGVAVRGPDDHRGGVAMRVVIAEDSVLLREGLTRLLTEAGHEVAAAEGDAEKFLRAVAAHVPDAVVVDVRMPPTFTDEGLRAALVVRDQWPDVGVLVLSQWVEERYATELISGRPYGVGYLLKDRVADVAEFLDALNRVASGGSALDPEVVSQLLARSRHPLGELTPREREVLALMAEGRSNSAIAEALVVGGGAVEKHINNIFTKLGLAPGDRDHRRVLAVLRYLGS